MPQSKKNIEKIISDAESIGIANPIKVRNIQIRRKFREMRDKNTNIEIRSKFRSMRESNVKYDDAVNTLADEYFLSLSSILQIICGYKNNDH